MTKADDLDVMMKLTGGEDGPKLEIFGMEPTHRRTRWHATGFAQVTYGDTYSRDQYIDHVLGTLPKLDKEIERACHSVSGREFMDGKTHGPLQIASLSLSPVREHDGRILVFFAVVLEEMPALPHKTKRPRKTSDGKGA